MWKFPIWFSTYTALVRMVHGEISILYAEGFQNNSNNIRSITQCIVYYPAIFPLPDDKAQTNFKYLEKYADTSCRKRSSSSAGINSENGLDSDNVLVFKDKIVLIDLLGESCKKLEQQIRSAHTQGAAGAIILESYIFNMLRGQDPFFDNMDKNLKGINMSISMISSEMWQELLYLGNNITMKQYAPPTSPYMDYSLFGVWILAMISIVLGTFWPPIILRNRRRRRVIGISELYNSPQPEVRQQIDYGDAQLYSGTNKLRKFEMINRSCNFNISILILLFYGSLLGRLSDNGIPIGTILFGIFGSLSLYKCLSHVATMGRKQANKEVQASGFMPINIAIGIFCLLLMFIWIVLEGSLLKGFSWIVYNVYGFALAITVIRTNRPPHVMICIVSLSLPLVFELIMLFIVPGLYSPTSNWIFKILVENFAGLVNENTNFHMTKLPRLTLDPYAVCNKRPWAISAFSFVLFPGQFIAFCYRLTSKTETFGFYFCISLAGYGISLALTLGQTCFSNKSLMPEFLYIVPCILVPVIVASITRNEFSKIWSGIYEDAQDNSTVNNVFKSPAANSQFPNGFQDPANSPQLPSVDTGKPSNLSWFQEQQQDQQKSRQGMW